MMDLVQYARLAGEGVILEDYEPDYNYDLEPEAVQVYLENEIG